MDHGNHDAPLGAVQRVRSTTAPYDSDDGDADDDADDDNSCDNDDVDCDGGSGVGFRTMCQTPSSHISGAGDNRRALALTAEQSRRQSHTPTDRFAAKLRREVVQGRTCGPGSRSTRSQSNQHTTSDDNCVSHVNCSGAGRDIIKWPLSRGNGRVHLT